MHGLKDYKHESSAFLFLSFDKMKQKRLFLC